MTQKNSEINIWNNEFPSFKNEEKYYDLILEQYKLYVQMADNISTRRNYPNTFFISLFTILMGGISFNYDKFSILENPTFLIWLWAGFTSLCFIWYKLINSYQKINKAKFEVIEEIEKKLPMMLWKEEWVIYHGEKKSKGSISYFEKTIPILFFSLFSVMIGYIIFQTVT